MSSFFYKKMSTKLLPHVGLDLGTTKSSICYILGKQSKEPTFVPLGNQGRISIPSLVSFVKEPDSAFPTYTGTVGLGAKYLAYANDMGLEKSTQKIECTFSQSKLYVGQNGFNGDDIPIHPAIKKSLPDFPEVTPEIVLAHIMQNLKNELEKHLRNISYKDFENYSCEDLTITVPANWNPEQRRATAFAAKIAGFKNNVELLDEPVSALIALREKGLFGISTESENVMVIDFGGGTCDICLLRVKEKHIELLDVRAKYIGGEVLDTLLFSMYMSKIRGGIYQIPEDILTLNVLPGITSFKEKLSDKMDESLPYDIDIYRKYMNKKYKFKGTDIQHILGMPDRGSNTLKMSYQNFDDLTLNIRKQFSELLAGAQDVAKGYGGVQRLFIVGGSSHLYFVRPMTQIIFENLEWGKTIIRPDLPERYVSLGASYYQHSRAHRKNIFDHKIFYNIGLYVPDTGQSENFVRSGSKLPCMNDKLITLKEDVTPTDKLTLRFERDDPIAKGSIEKEIIANRKVTPENKLRIFVQVKRDGIVDIIAKDDSSGNKRILFETLENYPLGQKFELVSKDLIKSFPSIRIQKGAE
jgi:hypothetical protein